MTNKVQYNTQDDRTKAIQDNANLYLIEEDNITEGNFLIFSDVAPTPPVEMVTIPESEYEDLQNQLLLAENQTVQGGIF